MVGLYILAGVVGFLVFVALAVGYVAYSMVLVRQEKKRHVQKKAGAPEIERQEKLYQEVGDAGRTWFAAQNPEDVSITSRDGLTLRGHFLPAKTPSSRLVVFSHGFTANGQREFGAFFQYYHEALNFNILAPDHRSHGRSDGKRIGFSALEWTDILDWAEAFIGRCEDDPQVVLHGMSMGAATVMNCNAHNPPDYVKFIIEDCGFTNGYEIQWLCAQRDLGMPKFCAPIMWCTAMWYRLFTGKSLRKDCDPYGKIAQFSKPTLFVSGAADPFVPAEMSIRCYEAATVPKELFLVEGARHVMAYYLDPEGYQAKISAWVDQWIKEEVPA